MSYKLLAVFAVFGILLWGCGDSSSTSVAPTSPTSASLFNGIAASFTDDNGLGAVAVNQNGERLTATTQTGSAGQITKVTGATFILPNGSSAVVFTGNDGLPARAVFGDVVALLANYTNNTVDVAIIAPNGAITVTRRVSVDGNALSDLKTLPPTLSTSSLGSTLSLTPKATGSSFNLVLAIKIGAALLKVATCGAAAGAAAASGGVLIPAAVGACASATISVLTVINPSLDSPALAATRAFLDAVTCVFVSIRGCVSLVLADAATIGSLAQSTQSTQSSAINTATDQLNASGCTYAISPTSQSFSAGGGFGNVTVTASPSGCTGNWTASSNTGFLAVTSGSSGTGNGMVGYSVSSNSSTSSRSGTLTIAGQTFSVTQQGAATTSCTYNDLTDESNLQSER